MKTLAYIRVSKDSQDVKNQRHEVLEYAQKNNIHIDDFMEMTVSSRKNDKDRGITTLLENLERGDRLIASEMSRLGRSTVDLLSTIKKLNEKGVTINFVKQNIDTSKDDVTTKCMMTLYALFAEIERDFISQRTKEALAAKKAQGIKLGLPKGTILGSKFDQHSKSIITQLACGIKTPEIAKNLGLTSHRQLANYIKKGGLREIAREERMKYNLFGIKENNINNYNSGMKQYEKQWNQPLQPMV